MNGDDGDIGDWGNDPRSAITEGVIRCIIHVHRTLGPGFLERIYRRALLVELRKCGLRAEAETEVLIYYEGELIGRHRLDLLVEGQVIVELKTADALCKAHYAQVRSYLKASKLDVALLVNFGLDHADFRRIER